MTCSDADLYALFVLKVSGIGREAVISFPYHGKMLNALL